MATQAQAVATREPNAIVVFRRELESRASEIKAALPSHISGEKFQRTVTTAVMQNQDLLKADRRSLLLACMKAAQDGLLPDGREAALVTFSTRVKEGGDWVSKQLVQYMPMVYGLRKKVLQARNPEDGSPLVVALETGVVYRAEWEGGYFIYEVGSEPPLKHRVMLDIKDEEATDENIIAAYSIATMSNGQKSYEVMRRVEIDKVRQVSQTGALGRTVKFGAKKGEPIPPKGPWVDWFAEMAKKTVVRRHTKTLPMSGDVLIESGTEAAEFEAASGTATLLGSQAPDEPERLEDQSDDNAGGDADAIAERERIADEEGADRETGELPADPGQAGKAAAEAAGKEPKPRTRSRAAPKPDEEGGEGNASGGAAASSSEPASAGETEHSEAEPRATAATAAPAEPGPEPEPDPAELIAERMDKAETIIDLERIYDDSEDAINEMEGEQRGDMLRCYAANRRRLGVRTEPTP